MIHSIPFTQYLRPHGKTRFVTFKTSDDLVADKAKQILSADLRFECEVLTNGFVSLTITDDEEDLAIEVTPNDSHVTDAVTKLITNFQFRGQHTSQQARVPDQTPTNQT